MSKKIIVITGASSGFGRLTANALAKAGHTVYASMRDTAGRNAPIPSWSGSWIGSGAA
jgi:NADP-dependent 3-hydroxy acid dehydrogenase YdfG